MKIENCVRMPREVCILWRYSASKIISIFDQEMDILYQHRLPNRVWKNPNQLKTVVA